MTRSQTIQKLEAQFRQIVLLQYDTSVPVSQVDVALEPYLDENVSFKDPWQTAQGKQLYQTGQKGFHCLFFFHLEITQLNVTLNKAGTQGRTLVDGVMYLRQFGWLFTYPLRTLLVYDFTVQKSQVGKVQFLITHHEEMWSLGDMVENLPGMRQCYKRFRESFGRTFLLVSKVSFSLSRAFKRRIAQ